MQKFRWFIVALLLLLAVPYAAQDSATCESFQGSPEAPAPDFPQGLDWVNTSEPLTISGFRGQNRVVGFLDVWLHQLPSHDPRLARTRTGLPR